MRGWCAAATVAGMLVSCSIPNPAYQVTSTGDGTSDGTMGGDTGSDTKPEPTTAADTSADDVDGNDDQSVDADAGDTSPALDIGNGATSTSDTGSTEGGRCRGMLWGINRGGDLVLIDVIEQNQTMVASFSGSSHAIASRSDGTLLVVPHETFPAIFSVDPMTGAVLDMAFAPLELDGLVSRAAISPSGGIWLATRGGDDTKNDLVQLEDGMMQIHQGELLVGGDHVFLTDSVMLIVAEDGWVAEASLEDLNMPTSANLVLDNSEGFTGVSGTDGAIWASTNQARLVELTKSGGMGWQEGQSFASNSLDDLSVAFLDECPHGVEPTFGG